MQLHEKADTKSVIVLLEYTRLQYNKIFVIMDNTEAHISKAMDRYIESMEDGAVRRFRSRAYRSIPTSRNNGGDQESNRGHLPWWI